MTFWTLTRMCWGIATLLVYVYKIELLQDSDTPVWSFVLLVCLFFFLEILPIIALLDYSYFNLTGLEQVEIRWAEDEDYSAPQPVMMDPLLTTETVPPARAVRWFDELDNEDPLENAAASSEQETGGEEETEPLRG